jgi:hypothetical protein
LQSNIGAPIPHEELIHTVLIVFTKWSLGNPLQIIYFSNFSRRPPTDFSQLHSTLTEISESGAPETCPASHDAKYLRGAGKSQQMNGDCIAKWLYNR